MPNAAHTSGIGIASRSTAVDAGVGETSGRVTEDLTGSVVTAGCADGTISNGCVLLILTAVDAGAVGSGRMLMRAVSFFGPLCEAEPG